MAQTFSEVVDKVQGLDLESKIEIYNLLDRWIADERRKEIAKNAEISRLEFRAGKTKSFTNAADMIRNLNEG